MDNIDYLEQIFENIRNESENTTEQGKRFENLIAQWLCVEPLYKDKFIKVQTWNDWVDEFGKSFGFNHTDIGVDLVAQNAENPETFTAIQCKFYSENNTINKADMDSFFSASENACFTLRILVSSNQKLSENFKITRKTSSKECIWINYYDLEKSSVDWEYFLSKNSLRELPKRTLFDFQKDAVDSVVEKFKNDNIERGKLIMACGTGKTFTSLKIAEQLAPNGIVLFLVPSLALLSQTLRDWKQQNENIIAFAVCSDNSIGIRNNKDDDDEFFMNLSDLAYPATTDAQSLVNKYNEISRKNSLNLVENVISSKNSNQKMVVIFCTYQSSIIIGEAQQKYNFPDIDLMICDEAHRTATGKSKFDKNNGETNFSYVHKNENINAKKRLYMTATPKIYGNKSKQQKDEGDVVLYSMDDEKIFGNTLYTINFNEAIYYKRLVDFKVIILTLSEKDVFNIKESYLQKLQAQNQNISFDLDISLDYFAKIIGCYTALRKYGLENDLSMKDDLQAMKRAVAFAQVIDYEREKHNNILATKTNENIRSNFVSKKNSKTKLASKFFAEYFGKIVEAFKDNERIKLQSENQYFHENFEKNFGLICETEHIDGSMSAEEKDKKLDWLREDPAENHCKILFNVRCLSEGIDVPSLDAVIFLSPKKSEVEIVQTIGRVMRVAPNKKRGYVIIPILLPEKTIAKDFFDKSEEFGTIWKILCAIRSIDPNISLSADVENGNLDSRKIEVISGIQNQSINKNINKNIHHSNQIETEVKIDKEISITRQNSDSNQNNIDPNSALDAVSQKQKNQQLKSEQHSLQEQLALQFLDKHELNRLIKARIVKRVGNRHTWEDWAEEVGGLCDKQINYIKRIINDENNAERQQIFTNFANEINNTLNGNLSTDDVCEMLAQHLVMQPIMEALFVIKKNVKKNFTNAETADIFEINNTEKNNQNLVENVHSNKEIYNYAKQNPIACAMNNLFNELDKDSTDILKQNLNKFRIDLERKFVYKRNQYNIIASKDKQDIIRQLFDNFFKVAFPKQQEKLGIVYTPIEIIDFINHSVNDLLKQEFNQQLSDQDVHILDPFTGTGSFLTRLMQNDAIIPKDVLEYKFKNDLHANEIMPLSYYVAGMNFESVFHEILPETIYEPNQILVWTDTFANDKFIIQQQQQQAAQRAFTNADFNIAGLQQNNLSLQKQNNHHIRIIIGNPPYSIRQKSQNDNNQNDKYELLDQRIRDTYFKHSKATLKYSLYDSYIRAFRWATDRIENNGIIGFVCNAGWLDSTSADGMRYCLEREFSKIYIYNLRGNHRRMTPEQIKKEGEKIFNGCTSAITIVFLIKKQNFHEKAEIFYSQVDDYLSMEEKLELVETKQTILNLELHKIIPNEHNDWINLRDDSFNNFINIGSKDKNNNENVIFKNYSLGVRTNRDSWAYNSSSKILSQNMQRSIDFYNSEVERANIEKNNFEINFDKSLMAWDLTQRKCVTKNIKYENTDINNIRISMYRPFFKQFLYFDRFWNNSIYKMPKIFPRENTENFCICVTGIGNKVFSCIMTNKLTDLNLLDAGAQCFPLYLYQEKNMLGNTQLEKIDAITNEALQHFQAPFLHQQQTISKNDIFYYIYGLLHSKEYRKKFANNLMKQLPRIPRMQSLDLFNQFKIAGENLAHLHLHFDNFNDLKIPNTESIIKELNLQININNINNNENINYQVDNNGLRYAKLEGKKGNAAKNKSKIIYNNNISIENIPPAVQEYIVNKKSALDWLVERCCIKQDNNSGIINNFNDYCTEIGDEKYIYKLLINVIYISVESVKIINNLPSLQIYEKDL